MKKSYKSLLILFLLAIIIILAFLFVKTPEYKFAKKTSYSYLDNTDESFIITPDILAKSILEENTNTILVDIRNRHEFVNGHIPDAKHIAKENILEKDNFKFFKKLKKNNQHAILYGENVEEANIPFMILKQLGVENIGISSKGYRFFNENDLKDLVNYNDTIVTNETPVIDIAKFIEEENKNALERIKLENEIKKVEVKKITPIIKKTVVTKPKPAAPVVEEEDEGC